MSQQLTATTHSFDTAYAYVTTVYFVCARQTSLDGQLFAAAANYSLFLDSVNQLNLVVCVAVRGSAAVILHH
jgi:hypothetical protein